MPSLEKTTAQVFVKLARVRSVRYTTFGNGAMLAAFQRFLPNNIIDHMLLEEKTKKTPDSPPQTERDWEDAIAT